MLCILQCRLYIIQCTFYTVHFTLYIVYFVQCSLYSVRCTRYTVHCTMHTLKYTTEASFYVHFMYTVIWCQYFYLDIIIMSTFYYGPYKGTTPRHATPCHATPRHATPYIIIRGVQCTMYAAYMVYTAHCTPVYIV